MVTQKPEPTTSPPDVVPVIVPEASQWELAWTDGTAPRPEVHWEMLEVIKNCLDIDGKYVLEVGSGTGHDSVALATLGAKAFALDLTKAALNLTRETSGEHNASVGLIAGNTLSLPFSTGSFDIAFSQGLIEHFSDPEPVIREQTRVVRSGGFLLVDVPQRYSLYTLHKRRLMREGRWFAGWETEFSLSELKQLLQRSGLEPKMSYGYGYFPAAIAGVRNLHTIDRRRLGSFRLPQFIGDNVENGWRALESSQWYYRWLTSIGVIAMKP